MRSSPPIRAHLKPRAQFLALEARQLFDGAVFAAAAHAVDTAEHHDASAPTAASTAATDAHPATEASHDNAHEGAAPAPASTPAAPATHEVYVVDESIQNWQQLVAALPTGAEVILIDPTRSGSDQLAQALAGEHDISALHILSHGSSEGIVLGTDHLTADTLASMSADWRAIGQALTQDGDILLYGCDVAEGSTRFIDSLAALTQADVAASTDATGSAARGGDWQLEAESGHIEATALAITAYDGLLAAPTVTDSVGGTRQTAEDTALTITGITVGDADNPPSLTATFTATGGTLTLAGSGWTVTGGANNSGTVTITGSITAVNAALNGIVFHPDADKNASVTGYASSLAISVNDGSTTTSQTVQIAVTPVNDAPVLNGVALNLAEGGHANFTLQQLAPSANALDADIASGQQVLAQQMMRVDSLPAHGTLTYLGGPVLVGTIIPVSNLANLVYTHDGSDLPTTQSDTFNITVNDGGGGTTAGSIAINIAPVNVAPAFSGTVSLYEGQMAAVIPSFTLGDSFDTPANSTITVTSVTTGGQGSFFFDANNNNVIDAGELVTGTRTFAAADAALFKFFQNGSEPNAPGAVAPSFSATLTDAGGGTGTPASVSQTFTIEVKPNNDDPVLTVNLHPVATPLVVGEFSTTVLDSTMLHISDADLNPADTTQPWPDGRLVYVVQTVPAKGELQILIGATWYVMGAGSRFTQADLAAGNVRYVETLGVPSAGGLDQFTFKVRDSAYGYDLSDPAVLGPLRAGADRNPDGSEKVHTFAFSITDNSPLPGSGPGTSDLATDFADGGSNSASGAGWREDNFATSGVIDSTMLQWTLTRTSGGSTIYTVPANETVYTLTSLPDNGTIQRLVGGVWTTLSTGAIFTQADIDAGGIRFVHDGGETFISAFDYKVSDGNETHDGHFVIDVAPINDRPVATGGSATVREQNADAGTNGIVRLGTGAIGMSDVDGAVEPAKQLEPEGNVDFLWFEITSLPAHGTLQRWNGTSWVAVAVGEWLPSTLLTATADGATSGLRYVHDGSEPLAYPGGPKVTFDYVVRDDLTDPSDPFAVDTSTPADTSGSPQSNQSDPATTTIGIVPVNNRPQIADKPGDPDPVLTGGVIAGGGATTGANDVLAVTEGSTTVITNAYLQAVDPDNTTVQRQFRLTQLPTLGQILLDGKVLGIGSTFTQDDIDNGRVVYKHLGADPTAPTTDAFGTYNDKFNFIVDDGVSADAGADANNNVFLITIAPANDAPTVTAPTGTILITDTNDHVSGFSVNDPDLATVSGTEVDFLQVTVRLLDHGTGSPVAAAEYAGVTIGVGGVLAGIGTHTGVNTYLTIQGTQAQVNAALAALTVDFAADRDKRYDVQVIVDDRVRDGAGTLVDRDAVTAGTQVGGNGGGTVNSAANGTITTVRDDEFDWSTDAVPSGASLLVGNIAAKTVTIATSQVNDPAVLTITGNAVTTYEDQATFIGGSIDFGVSDPESEGFDTPVTVTLSVGTGNGALGVGSLAGVTVGGNNSATLTLTGRADLIESMLNTQLTYKSPTDANHDRNGGAAGDVTLSIALDDIGSRFGSGGASNVVGSPQTVAITIDAVNDAPGVTVGSTVVPVTGVTAIAGVSVTDLDLVGDGGGVTTGETDFIQVTVRLTTDSGTALTGAQHADVHFSSSSAPAEGPSFEIDDTYGGNGSALVVRGTLAQVNAYLAGLQVEFTGTLLNSDSNYKIEVIADDRLRNVATGALDGSTRANGGGNPDGSDPDTLPDAVPTTAIDPYAAIPGGLTNNVRAASLTVFPTTDNDPATITASNVTVAESTGSVGTVLLDATNAAITIADPDDLGASTMTVNVSLPTGFTFSAVGGTGGPVTGVGTGTISFSGTEAEINSKLQALTVQLPDPSGTPTAADWTGSFTLTIVYDDMGNTGNRPSTLPAGAVDSGGGLASYEDGVGGSSNHLVTTRTLTVTVAPANDAPVLTGTASNPTFTEDGTTGNPTTGTPVKLLTGGASIDDVDLSTTAGLDATVFGHGSITVDLSAGDWKAGDTLFVDLGTLPAGVTVSGGTGGTALTIDLAPGTTIAEVNTLLNALSYVSTTDDPTAGTRHYSISVNDGVNDQGGGHTAGTGGAKTSNVVAGTITVVPTNDAPLAQDNTNHITENTASISVGAAAPGVTGGLLVNDVDPDSTLTVTAIRTGPETGAVSPVTGSVGVALVGQYGTLTVQADGSYVYVLDNANPTVNALRNGDTLTDVFTYTASDGSASDTAQLTITIDGLTDLSVLPVDGNGAASGHATVYEAGLTSSADTRETTTGTITLGAPLGIDHLDIGGTTLTPGQLAALGTTPIVIDTGEGLLTLTGYSTFGPGPGVDASIAYSYTLKTAQNHPGVSFTDDIALHLVQNGGDTSDSTLQVEIVNDVPVAQNDANGLQIGNGATGVSGNVVTGGSSGDRADAVGADTVAAPVTAVDFGATHGTVGTPLAGAYGRLTLAADGSYHYEIDSANPQVTQLAAGQVLVETFTYTITDADGDTSTAELKITIQGPDATVPKGDQIFGGLDQRDPPVIYQPFEPAVFVQLAVADSAKISQTLSGQMGDGDGVEVGEEIQSDLVGIDQDMTNTEHVSRDGVKFSRTLMAEGQSRARGIGNSLVVGAESLYSDFSPFSPLGVTKAADAAPAAADANAAPAPTAPAAPATPATPVASVPPDRLVVRMAELASAHDAQRESFPVFAAPRFSEGAASFSSRIAELAALQAPLSPQASAAPAPGSTPTPAALRVAQAQPV